ncbi:hypothetical protein ACFX2A_041643 [Malus domestica]
MDFATIQAQLAKLTSQLSQYAEKTTMQSVPTCGVSYGQGYPTHQCSQFTANEDAWVIKAIANHGTTCFPMLTIRIGEIIQITCGENLNNSNKMGIGSKKMSSIQDLCSHHNNLPNSIQEVQNGNKEMQNQAKKTGELEKQIGQIMEFMAQIQEQSELSNTTIENLKEDFEIHDAITLGSAMEVGGEPKTSKPSQNMDKQLLLEE